MANLYNSNPSLTNVTFSDNSARNGGAIYNHANTNPSLTNVTFSHNSANNGSGMLNSFDSSPIIENSIFWHNSGNPISNQSGANPTISYSLVQGCNPDGVWNSACGTGAGNNNLPDANPLLAPLTDNGGPTLTHMPRIDSPAIAAGNCSSGPATDQRGEPRPQDTTCDIGSVEVQPDEDRWQHCGLTAYQTYAFAATAVHIEIETVGNLSCLDVGITNAAHPTATANIPAPYVTITTTPALATGYVVTMTLLHPDYDNPLLCKYPGNMGGGGWDCARDGFDNNLVWRGNITGFSDWAVGHDVSPTAVSLQVLRIVPYQPYTFLVILLLLIATAAVLLNGQSRRQA